MREPGRRAAPRARAPRARAPRAGPPGRVEISDLAMAVGAVAVVAAHLSPALRWTLVAALIAGTAIATVLGAIRTRRHGRDGWRWRRWRGGARWATAADLRRLRLPARNRDHPPDPSGRPAPGRLVLGRAGRHLVATEARHSVLVLGPTQSGKTTGLAVPAILEWKGPVVATSVKGDLVAGTLGWRSTQGSCWVYDPTASAPVPTRHGWSPLSEAASWSGAQRVSSWLVESTPTKTGLTDSGFWYAAASKLLAPLLLAASRSGATMPDVVAWTNLQDVEAAERILGDAGEVEAGVALFASAGRDERIRSSIYTTLETVLAPFEDPVVASSASRHDIEPRLLLQGNNTLYLCGPAHEQARVQGVFAALVSSVIHAAVDAVHLHGRPLDPALLVVLDEVANIAPLRDLDTLASTAAGMGIQLVTVCQDLAQLATRYGAERARTIANNHRAKVVLSGIADVGTLDTMSGLAGEAAVREQTVTSDHRDGRRTTSSSVAYRRLAPADELRRIRPGEGVLVYGHLPPARLRLRPWYAHAELRRRAGFDASADLAVATSRRAAVAQQPETGRVRGRGPARTRLLQRWAQQMMRLKA